MEQRYFAIIVLCAFSVLYIHGQDREIVYSPGFYTTQTSMFGYEINRVWGIGADDHPAYEEELPDRAVPLGGTVSHHNLVAPYIDGWFQALKQNRPEIPVFIIISPRHFKQGKSAYISLSSLPWESGKGMVEVDTEVLAFLQQLLGLEEDREAFDGEHGIGTLVPYIKKHYPGSKIVPILQKEHPYNAGEMHRLSDALKTLLFLRRDIFIMISTDFSHHHGIEETSYHDSKTEKTLRNFSAPGSHRVYGDNIVGTAVLGQVASAFQKIRPVIVYHTDSYQFTGLQEEDITSYFFTFYY